MIKSITDFIEKNVIDYPDKILFSDENCSVTVKEFRTLSRKVASGIIQLGISKKPLAIFVDKSVESLISFMGVAYSGNFYVPIDTSMPPHRIKSILDILEPAAVIVSDKYIDVLRSMEYNSTILSYERIVNHVEDHDAVDNAMKKIVDSDALYVLFTSGSTGIPKGVVVSHKSVIAYASWVTDEFNIDSRTVFGNQTPFYFSMSVLDIFATIKSAATMYIIPKPLFSFPVRLLDYIKEKGINTIYWVPSALCQVANFRALGTRDISCLRKVLFAGEPMPVKQLNMWIEQLPGVFFANLFGPTEATDISNYYTISRQLSEMESVPIGSSCNNTNTFIVGENNELVEEQDVIGELYIRGTILAYGYYNNPEKTKEVFVQNPFNDSFPEIVYKTGDLVHINKFGELVYDGRVDNQIKHMGHRIELGEIETAVFSVDGIMQNCAIYDNDNRKIVLFYSGNVEENDLHESLKNLLPVYMLPAETIMVDGLPLNPNGKINRKGILERYRNGEYVRR